jgi:hypothetical protein
MPTQSPKNAFVDMEAIIPNFLYRRQITLLAGAPYAGKSTGGLKTIAIPLATGSKDLFGFDRPPLKVLYCSERDWEFNCAQLRSVGIASLPDNLSFVCVPDILNTADIAKFEADPLAYIATLKAFTNNPPDVVFLDTATNFQCQTNSKDVNNYSHQRGEMIKFKRWASKHNLAILAEFHSPKQNSKTEYADHFDKILGSTAILAASTAAAVMERCSNGLYVCIHFRSHLTKLESPRYFRYGDYVEVEEQIATSTPQSDRDLDMIKKGSQLTARESDMLLLVPKKPTPYAEFIRSMAITFNIEENNARNIAVNLAKKGFVKLEINPDTDEKVIWANPPQ